KEEPGGGTGLDDLSYPEETMAAAFTSDISRAEQDVRDEIENETLGGAVRRSIQILVRLFHGTDTVQVEQIGPLLEGVVRFYLRRSDFASLGHLLWRIRESKLLTVREEGDRLFDAILREIREATTPAAMIQFLNKEFGGDYQGVDRFFGFLGAAGIRLAASIYGRIPDQRARQGLRKILTSSGFGLTPDVCTMLMQEANLFASEILDILADSGTPRIHDRLRPFLSHRDPAVRTRALRAAALSEGPRRATILSESAKSVDAETRRTAYGLMVECRDPDLRRPLMDLVRSRGFLKLEPWEKNAAVRALCFCAGEPAVALMRELVERKAPFFRRAQYMEVRRAAVEALSDLRTEPARGYLERLQKSKDGQLRRLAGQAGRLEGR
ncbi:MAG: HEAT repeat domain-containing protein, partial [Planctomycetota bacterium]